MKTTLAVASAALLFGAEAVLAGCGACGAHAKKDGGSHSHCKGNVCASKEAAKQTVEVETPSLEVQETPTISTSGLATLLRSGVPVVVLDARSGKWDDGRRLPGAGSLHAGSSKSDIAKAIPSKDALVVTYCSNVKCQASPKLARRLKELGYKNVIEYPEGIDGWTEAGLDVKKVAKN